MSSPKTNETFALKFGELQPLLTRLLDASEALVLSRFRKLRPKFAADGLLTETGNWVSYDLTRVLAICATFEINALSVPQGHSVDIIVGNWPELAKAFLKSWRGVNSAKDQAKPAPAIIRIYVDTLGRDPVEGSWASVEDDAPTATSHIALHCGPIVAAVAAAAEYAGKAGPLAAAFEELESTFGWEDMKESDACRLPLRSESDFFGTGPYFKRARALLAVDPNVPMHARSRARLQAMLDYLEKPAPIDSWKRFIGTETNKPRLVHLLAAYGAGLGLESNTIGHSGVLHSAFDDREAAIRLIERGERRAAELAMEPRT